MASISDYNIITKSIKKPLITFSFGKNWQDFLRTVNIKKVKIAMDSLTEFLGDLDGKNIIDIGSGSGLFSFSMYLLGAKEITSMDIDPFSIKCANFLRSNIKNQTKWKIIHESILNKKFISQLGKYDIVYSWGVLHHTGKMWEAIRNSATLVRKNGLFYIAIYNKTRFSDFWLKIKIFYNLLPFMGKVMVDYGYFIIYYLLYPLFLIENPFRLLKSYQDNRGMNPIIDIRDWLGGYPFEYATFDEIVNYVKKLKGNYELIKYKRYQGSTNNLYLFRRNN